MLQRATTEQAFLKVGIYGGPGSGKTLTALKCACALGKTAVIDTEHGTDFYAADFEFDVEKTRSIDAVYDTLELAIKEKYDCFIIDQLTHVWESVQDEILAREQKKGSKIWQTYEKSGNMNWTIWKYIKRPWRDLMRELLNAPLHVFILGRASSEYEVLPSGDPKKTGERMDAEKSTPHEPHILIKMEYDKIKRANYAFVEKDRSRTIQGEIFKNPDISMFAGVMLKLGKVQGQLPPDPPSPFDVDIDFGKGAMLVQDQQRTLIRKLAERGGIAHELVEEKLKGMTREVAGQVINQMTVSKFDYFKT